MIYHRIQYKILNEGIRTTKWFTTQELLKKYIQKNEVNMEDIQYDTVEV